jgi:very-short-patch-repair endonuclease
MKNLKSPGEVAISSNKKYIFDCHICNHEYDQRPSDKTLKGSGCPFCSGLKICGILDCKFCLKKSCHIYADIWSVKNVTRDCVYIKPETVSISNSKKYIFDCHVCNHEYEQSPNDKTRGRGCPYCGNRKLCGFLDCKFCLAKGCYVYRDIWSIKNITKDGVYIKPETVSVSSGVDILFNCNICNHEYKQTPHGKTKGQGCPYCSKPSRKLCGSLYCEFCLRKSCHVYADIWSVKNITTDGVYIKPETVSIGSDKKFWFDCKKCNHEYGQKPNDKIVGSGCPLCVNKTEQIVAKYLKEMNINFIPQYRIGNINKFYDFYLPDNKLIIEVDGNQHFIQIMNWQSPEENLQNDIQKTNTALSEGISVLRIYQPDIWMDKIDWKSCINENLCIRSVPKVVTRSSNPEIYNNHTKFNT